VFNGLWYDGETAGAKGSDGAGYASSGCGITEMADGTGYGASTHYLRLTITTSSWYASGSWMNESAMPQTRDVSSFSALELWWRIPTASIPAGNDFRPDIVLVSGAGQSLAVSATSYLDSQTVPGVDTWVHSTIPLSAFAGADLTTVKAITFQPAYGQYSGGSYSGTVDLDNVQFTHASGLPLRDFNGLFADFALLNASYTGQYWYTANDALTCLTATALTFPTGGNPPMDAGGNTLSPLEEGHFSGTLGGGGCNSYAQMACALSTGPVSLADSSFFKAMPTGATGMRFALKLGPGSDPTQVYHVVLTEGSVTAGGADFYVQVAGKDLSTTQFTYYQVAFPANGSKPALHGYSDTSELWWGQPGWVTAANWDDTTAEVVRVQPATAGVAFDVMVDDIEFYTGPAPTPTITPTFSASPTYSVSPAPPADTDTNTPSPTPQDTATSSATPTPQDTASNTPSPTPQDTASSTPGNTPQDTASVTPSSTPSPTATPSPIVFHGLWYDGETAGALGSDGSGYASSGSGITEMADGTGYGASTHYLRLTVTAAGSWYAAGAWMNESAMPQTRDVSSFSALELWWRIPSGSVPAGNDLRPNIVLVSNSGQSQPVSATAYLDSQTVPGVDTWVHSTIPLSAFTGMDLTTIKAISVQPAFGQYDDSGNYTGALDLDNVQFTHASGLPLRAFNGLYSDFSLLSGATYTGTYWYTVLDAFTPCTTTTSMSYPTSGGKPIDAGGNTLSPLECGHFAGHLGNGGSCTNATYAQMASEFVTGSSVNLSDGSFFKTLPTGATGMRFALKLGPNSGAGQVYHVVLTMNAVTQGGADYYVQVAGSSLSTTQYTYFQVAFPANGTTGTAHSYGSSNELWFGQIPWATAVPWDDTGAKAVRVDAATRGADFDIMVDDIELY